MLEQGQPVCRCLFPLPDGSGCSAVCARDDATGAPCTAGTWTPLHTFAATPSKRMIELTSASAGDGRIALGWGEQTQSTWGTTLRMAEADDGGWSEVVGPVGPINRFSSSRMATVRYAPDGRLFVVLADNNTTTIGGALYRREGASWVSYTTVSALPGATHVRWQAIAFTSDGTPLIAASENVSGGGLDEKVFLHRWTGGGWQVSSADAGSVQNPNGLLRPNLEVAGDTPLVAFDQLDMAAVHAVDGGIWTDDATGLSPPGQPIRFLRMSKGGGGRVFLSLIRQGRVFVYERSGGVWLSHGALPCGAPEVGAAKAVITVDSEGAPTAAWTLPDGGVQAQWLSESGWVAVPGIQLSGGSSMPLDLALSPAPGGGVVLSWIHDDGSALGVGRISP